MKKNHYKANKVKKGMKIMAVAALSAVLLAGCGQSAAEDGKDTIADTGGAGATETQRLEDTAKTAENTDNAEEISGTENQSGGDQTAESGNAQLEVRFGDSGEAFMMTLLDNETAAAIARYVGTSDWRLPIYERDDDVDYSVLQYYDIPSRYDIPDGSQSVTSQKAGAVYYSHPNRIILFYQDANISTEYTPVGYIDFSQDLVDAVENNPVVEGWGNKLIFIQP